MYSKIIKHIIYFTVSVLAATCGGRAADCYAEPPAKTQQHSKSSAKGNASRQKGSATANKGKGVSAKNRNASTTSKKGSGSAASKKGTSKKKTTGKRVESSADVKKREEAARKEIRLTQQQIEQNEAEVKKNLNQLGLLQTDIESSKAAVAKTTGEVERLQQQIEGLQTEIGKNRQEVERLRSQYLRAVKKMRLKKKNGSDLAFIFSSESFGQALRRMRYLRRFSEWKEKRSSEINTRIASLKYQTELLAQTKTEKGAMLRKQQQEQQTLQSQYAAQDAVVVELKRNGSALKKHLAGKQAEANQLRNQVASLIANEQAKAAREEQARREADARKKAQAEEAARQKAAREAEAQRLAAEKAEAQRQAEEKRKAEAQRLADNKKNVEKNNTEKVESKKPTVEDKSKTSAEEKRKAEAAAAKERREQLVASNPSTSEKAASGKTDKPTSKTDKQVAPKSDAKDYASARKRKPRTEEPKGGAVPKVSKSEGQKGVATANTGKSEATKNTGVAKTGKSEEPLAGNFEKMKGQLPRPVGGSFKITSRFGRHSLPDMPDVEYDNPGIDAEVASGATALAVYGGKVSGVYVIPGFSTVVILNHGSYYTVYGNIASPGVKVGDTVKQGQGLGRVAASDNNPSSGSIHFEVWRNREKLNPLEWLR